MQKVDYLIVGQGIAGTLLAYFLLKRNREIFIVDHYNPSSASIVGAGLFNPITGKRNVKTWMADIIFPFAERTYRDLETVLNQSFYHKINLIKLFDHEEEQNNWVSKINIDETSPYMVDTAFSGLSECIVNTNYFAELKGTGFVDMASLILAFKTRMLEENRFLESNLESGDLKFEGNYVYWKNIQAQKIIFCDGYKATQNKFFSWLPFVLAKGDVLTIHAEKLKLEKILNKGIFVLPLGEDKYRVGSTYNWNYNEETPDDHGKEELSRKLSQFITCPFSICDHKAGIRPTVKDRKPLMGLHPVRKNVGIFNGLGTKGATLAPYFAQHFVEFLEDAKPLEKTVNIQRFYIPNIDK